jgi:hypothetical protein
MTNRLPLVLSLAALVIAVAVAAFLIGWQLSDRDAGWSEQRCEFEQAELDRLRDEADEGGLLRERLTREQADELADEIRENC